MYTYIKGIVTETNIDHITLENNGIGYKIYTADPYKYKIDSEDKVYIYQNVKEDELTLYGFRDSEEKELFLKLIGVKGLGCKMALPLLAVDTNNVIDAIEAENISYLKKFPKIGDKVARQIILDLKGKLISIESDNKATNKELEEALKALGYKPADIKNVISKVDNTISVEKQIKEALKLLLK